MAQHNQHSPTRASVFDPPQGGHDDAFRNEGGVDPERFEAFTQHLAQCQTKLLAHALAMVQNMADAEDICQQAMMIMWRKFEQYTEGTNFGSWALKTTQYVALNFIRQRRRERTYFRERTLEVLTAQALEEASCGDTEERWSILRECLKKLPRRQRRLIDLYYMGSRTIAEVAQYVGRTEAAVRTALCRSRNLLRECVDHALNADAGGR